MADAMKERDFHVRMDQMQNEYVELIKKFKGLEKEKSGLQKIVDELSKANEVMEKEFNILFK
jgi:hypothetical protein